MTSKRPFFQSRRQAVSGFLCLTTGLLSAFGAVAGSASAADAPAVFPNPGYDTYLKASHRGVAAAAKDNESPCPDLSGVSGETAWHFVLDGNDHDFLTLDVAFTIEGSNVTLSGLTPKAATDPTFDPALNFAPAPTGKHAYVFTANTGTVRDAAAHVLPDAVLETDFQLSHTCVGSGTTTTTEGTTTTTEGTTTTTEGTTTTTEGTTTTTEGTTTTTEGTTTTTEGTTTTTEGTTTTTEGTTTTTEGTTTTTEGTTTTTEGPTTTTEGTTTSVLGSVVTKAADPTTTASVQGVQVTRSLPRTGGMSLPLAQAGTVLIAIGMALVGSARRRTITG